MTGRRQCAPCNGSKNLSTSCSSPPKRPASNKRSTRIAIEPGVVVPLLNGIEHLAWLRERFADVVAATIRVEADSASHRGVIEQTSPFLRIELSAHPEVAELLNEAGIPAAVSRARRR